MSKSDAWSDFSSPVNYVFFPPPCTPWFNPFMALLFLVPSLFVPLSKQSTAIFSFSLAAQTAEEQLFILLLTPKFPVFFFFPFLFPLPGAQRPAIDVYPVFCHPMPITIPVFCHSIPFHSWFHSSERRAKIWSTCHSRSLSKGKLFLRTSIVCKKEN